MKKSLIGGVLLLLAALGCGRQDRYEIAAPPLITVATDGLIQDVQVIRGPAFSGGGPRTAFLDGELLLAATNGQVFRVLEDGYMPLPGMPTGISSVYEMVEGPDGVLWVLTNGEDPLWRWDGQTWESFSIPESSWRYEGLLCDSAGRVYLWDDSYGLSVRHEDGSWDLEIPPEEVALVADWQGALGGPLALLGSRLELIVLTDEGWNVGSPLLDEPLYHQAYLAVDEEGRWAAVWADGSGYHLLADQGSGEESIPLLGVMRRIFWWEGALHCFEPRTQELFRWNGENWVSIQVIPNVSGSWSNYSYLARPDGYQLVFSGGETWFFDGTTAEPATPFLNFLTGETIIAGQPHTLTGYGWHLALEDGIWRRMGCPLEDESRVRDYENLLPAINGGALILGRDISFHWTVAGGYTILPQTDDFRRAFPQADGTVVIVGDDRLWHHTAAGLRDLGPAPSNSFSLVGVAIKPDGRVFLAHDDQLEVMENGRLRTLEFYLDSDVEGLVELPGEELFLYGRGRFVNVDSDSFLDLTPYFELDNDLYPARLVSAVDDGRGGILALDALTRTVLRLEAGRWEVVESTVWSDLELPHTLRRTPTGDIFFQGDDVLGLFGEVSP